MNQNYKNEGKYKPYNDTKYMIGSIIKIYIILTLSSYFLDKITYFKEHDLIKSIVIVVILIVFTTRIMFRIESLVTREMFINNRIEESDYGKSKKEFLNLYKSGDLGKFPIMKEAKNTIKIIFMYWVITFFSAYSLHDWSIKNYPLVLMIIFPFIAGRMAYIIWVRDETLKLMGYDIDELFNKE
ncbi:MAG: hypothetical protein N4A76_07505 [Firmicutes bacterium]|jgi:hypothetical protein|nr:hypothetical protein [Bacillota bacterium]